MKAGRNKLTAILITGIVTLSLSTLAGGQSAPTDAGQADSRPVPANTRADDNSIENQQLGDGDDSEFLGGTMRMLLSLALVVVLIFVARWLLSKRGRLGAAGGGGEPIEVVARTAVGPRQHLLIVRFGRRLVLVGASGTSFSALGQIDDAEEAEELLRSAAASQSTFQGIFKRKARRFAGAEDIDGLEETSNPLREVTDKMRKRLAGEKDKA